mmetsp:Transcript_3989/g.7493  ORF Transcript_3989/g.7493 Transcript_3989/m.7493 type:complete len:377 (-) Transcript_3989:377-1507(-)
MSLAVRPVLVRTIMAFAFEADAATTAASATLLNWQSGLCSSNLNERRLFDPFPLLLKSSVVLMICCMVRTVSRTYFPLAVSPESITASAPSITAFVTSETSALVGRGFFVIDSSICVATITGLPFSLHLATISFCARVTLSRGISTPRSPLATMIPSDSSKISSKLSHPSTFSILLIISGGLHPGQISSIVSCIYPLICLTPSASLTKLAATKSTSLETPYFMSIRSFELMGGKLVLTPGRFTPTRDLMLPSFITLHLTDSESTTESTFNETAPSSRRITLPALRASPISGSVTTISRKLDMLALSLPSTRLLTATMSPIFRSTVCLPSWSFVRRVVLISGPWVSRSTALMFLPSPVIPGEPQRRIPFDEGGTSPE